jgi:hypothetical protein
MCSTVKTTRILDHMSIKLYEQISIDDKKVYVFTITSAALESGEADELSRYLADLFDHISWKYRVVADLKSFGVADNVRNIPIIANIFKCLAPHNCEHCTVLLPEGNGQLINALIKITVGTVLNVMSITYDLVG